MDGASVLNDASDFALGSSEDSSEDSSRDSDDEVYEFDCLKAVPYSLPLFPKTVADPPRLALHAAIARLVTAPDRFLHVFQPGEVIACLSDVVEAFESSGSAGQLVERIVFAFSQDMCVSASGEESVAHMFTPTIPATEVFRAPPSAISHDVARHAEAQLTRAPYKRAMAAYNMQHVARHLDAITAMARGHCAQQEQDAISALVQRVTQLCKTAKTIFARSRTCACTTGRAPSPWA